MLTLTILIVLEGIFLAAPCAPVPHLPVVDGELAKQEEQEERIEKNSDVATFREHRKTQRNRL